MISSQSVAIDVLASFFHVIAFPLLEHEADHNDALVKSSSTGMHLNLNFCFRDLHRFWLMLEEEPTKDDGLAENGMWTFALGNAMLWWHLA